MFRLTFCLNNIRFRVYNGPTKPSKGCFFLGFVSPFYALNRILLRQKATRNIENPILRISFRPAKVATGRKPPHLPPKKTPYRTLY